MTYTLITGATSDIGKQICFILEKSGHSLLLTDCDENELVKTVSELNFECKHKYIALDLSSIDESKEKLSSFIRNNSIKVEYAVFAAGVFTIKPIKLFDYEAIKLNFDIALFSTFIITQILTSRKINDLNLKSIVFISSISSKIGTKGYSIYSSVKSAMLGAMRSMAVELAPKVRVNAILPGAIRTRTTSFLFDSLELSPRYLLGEGATTDIANMVEFLLSDKSKWITGQEFVVDGGMICN